ncbi:MAG: N,N'-diacetyllegionaminate synthase [Desulforhopalus sp.]|jgi:N,N'-diacetyllegionaminate synthase
MTEKVFIIGEAGVNHNGDLNLAYKLVDCAKEAGVDAVKFQTVKSPESMISKNAKMAEYQIKNTGIDESQIEMINRFHIDYNGFSKIKNYCDAKEILFLSTPFDIESISYLNKIGMNIFKIPSGEITNLPYLREIGKLKKQVILSTGMSNLGEIEQALSILESSGTQRSLITVLHCNTEYPTPLEDVNLRAMQTIFSAFPGIHIGYSDHTLGTTIPIAAVAMGASVIEKHFTTDIALPGPDHKASLDPEELKNMVRAIRNIEIALGNGVKSISPSEHNNITIARKSIVAKVPIKKGEVLTEEKITTKRPGTGICPMQWDEILGSTAKQDFLMDDFILI